MAAIEEITDTVRYEYTDNPLISWPYSYNTLSARHSTSISVFEPLERLFSTGIICGMGYTLGLDDETNIVDLKSQPE